MTKTSEYVSPAIISRAEMVMETSILQSSIVEFIGNVESTGQPVHTFPWDNNQSFFNHTWDE